MSGNQDKVRLEGRRLDVPMTPEWDVQVRETAKAYHAFGHYRDLLPADRSIDAAYLEHQCGCKGHQNSTKTAPRYWKQWSVAHRWVERATAHDADLSRQRRQRRAKELEEAQDRAATLARGALHRLAQRIKTMNINEIPAAVLDRWLKMLTDVELKALGHQDKVALEHSGKDGGPIQTDMKVILDALNDPEARDALDALSRRLESQSSGDGS